MEVNLDLGLGLGLGSGHVPKTTPGLLTKVSETQDKSQKLSMLQHYVENMEEEMKKIDAFKRELPLCMLLLNDGIGRLKEEVMECSKSKKHYDDDGWSIYENQIQVCSYNRSKGRQIMTFNGNSQFSSLSLVTPYPKYDFYYLKIGSMQFQCVPQSLQQHQPQQQQQQQQQPQKQQKQKQQFRRWKCRRRWSPALHQIFEDVLQRLGGPNGAKPKQVKELMNVDGLTCDEVKSHLQKYRLGLQRPPNSASATTRGRPRQMNIRRHLPNQTNTTSQSGSPQVPQFVTLEDTSSSGGGGNSTEAAVDENLSDGHSWRGQFRVMN
ncbi:hypothetical protein LWI28_028560 [Acer negundo]|uniref:HTH myb-type domain-containing protein n=1 Tax=Acer negundo TaxID=4023 RepID=A0AAD5NMG3_ACENE|nr:hypothetical protein LWI28_028560 [Acer negundo]KAK4840500.1 hypothetical protein QYF36_010316 [Acer negundo]